MDLKDKFYILLVIFNSTYFTQIEQTALFPSFESNPVFLYSVQYFLWIPYAIFVNLLFYIMILRTPKSFPYPYTESFLRTFFLAFLFCLAFLGIVLNVNNLIILYSEGYFRWII